jgi:hypothetical protein
MCEMWLKFDGAEISFERRSVFLKRDSSQYVSSIRVSKQTNAELQKLMQERQSLEHSENPY